MWDLVTSEQKESRGWTARLARVDRRWGVHMDPHICYPSPSRLYSVAAADAGMLSAGLMVPRLTTSQYFR